MRFAIVGRALRTVWPALVLLALWQGWIVLGAVSPLVAPSPAAVVRELVAHPLLYLGAAGVTASVAAAGLVAGMSAALLCALAARLTPFAQGFLTVPALLVQSTPLVALVPLLARIFGYGEATVVAGTTAITFLPTFVIVGAGLRRAPGGADDLFTALGASGRDRLFRLALPAAVPSLRTALRIAAANSVLAALVTEYLVGQTGLGHLFADAQSQLLVARAWAASIAATALSVSAYAAARRLERGPSSEPATTAARARTSSAEAF